MRDLGQGVLLFLQRAGGLASEGSGRATSPPPRLDHCMPACANIARTDNHARQLEQRASRLPTPLAERLRLNATKLHAHAKRHHDQRITTAEATP
ncbi:hypothetical protein AB0L50_09630 [Streptomyces flaveolus]|uniref:hypothetical protein n=1 Tax=Streptomyces flaveolus TaxID=67297 RepID=UPI00344260E8